MAKHDVLHLVKPLSDGVRSRDRNLLVNSTINTLHTLKLLTFPRGSLLLSPPISWPKMILGYILPPMTSGLPSHVRSTNFLHTNLSTKFLRVSLKTLGKDLPKFTSWSALSPLGGIQTNRLTCWIMFNPTKKMMQIGRWLSDLDPAVRNRKGVLEVRECRNLFGRCRFGRFWNV